MISYKSNTSKNTLQSWVDHTDMASSHVRRLFFRMTASWWSSFKTSRVSKLKSLKSLVWVASRELSDFVKEKNKILAPRLPFLRGGNIYVRLSTRSIQALPLLSFMLVWDQRRRASWEEPRLVLSRRTACIFVHIAVDFTSSKEYIKASSALPRSD